MNPYNEAQKRQIYSTDELIHEKEKKPIDEKQHSYCICGKKFLNDDELTIHIKKPTKSQWN